VESIIEAHSENKFDKPIVLRLKGTNVERAAELIKGREKELGITFTDDFDWAAQEAVKAANEVANSK